MSSPPVPPLRLQVLGPLRIWHGRVEVDPGPPQQAHLLAVLLARHGQPTGIVDLIEMIWGEHAPPSALNVVHKYVGALRRLLEPSLPPRHVGSYVRRRGNSYLVCADATVLDVARFEALVAAAAGALERGDPTTAHRHQIEALRLWTGPSGADLVQTPAMAPAFTRLNDRFLDACVAAAGLALLRGTSASVVPSLQLAATMAPFHEPVHASLVTALADCGRPADALAVHAAIRTRLAEELGIDPGPLLREAHRRVLAQTAAPSTTGCTRTLHPSSIGRARGPGRPVASRVVRVSSDVVQSIDELLDP